MLLYLALAGLGLLALLPLLPYVGGLRKTVDVVYTPTKREFAVWPLALLLAAAVAYCLAVALSGFTG